MATTMPQGWRRVKPILSCPVPGLASSGRLSPYSWVPSKAASRTSAPERPASPVASVMVLPVSALISRAVSSARSSASSAARNRIRMRSWAGVRRQVVAPRSAALSAPSTSSGPATGTVPTIEPSYGEVTSSVRPEPAAGRHRPPINISMAAMALASNAVAAHHRADTPGVPRVADGWAAHARCQHLGCRLVNQGPWTIKKPSGRGDQGRHVVRRDHLNAGGHRPDGSWKRLMRMHDEMTGAAHVLVEVMVEYCREAALRQKEPIILIEIMGDEHRAGALHLLECLKRGVVATADGVDRLDLGVALQGVDDQVS